MGGKVFFLFAPISFYRLAQIRLGDLYIQLYSFRIENWFRKRFIDSRRNTENKKTTRRLSSHVFKVWRKLRIKLFRHSYPHPHFCETLSFYESRERQTILITRDKVDDNELHQYTFRRHAVTKIMHKIQRCTKPRRVQCWITKYFLFNETVLFTEYNCDRVLI